MVVKKNITVEEVHDDGKRKVVYKGEDKRFYNQEYKSSFFGVPFGDWIKIGLIVFGIATFMIKDNIRIGGLEKTRDEQAGQIQDIQKRLADVTVSLQQYMEASDGFHSSVFATQFKAGRPIDGSFKNRGAVIGEVSK